MTADPADPVTGEVAPPEQPCGSDAGHWRHTWVLELPRPQCRVMHTRRCPAEAGCGARCARFDSDGEALLEGPLVLRSCPGRPGAAAAFADHRVVQSVRCYTVEDAVPCRRLLVFELPADGASFDQDLQGWRKREVAVIGSADRAWTCPQHSTG